MDDQLRRLTDDELNEISGRYPQNDDILKLLQGIVFLENENLILRNRIASTEHSGVDSAWFSYPASSQQQE